MNELSIQLALFRCLASSSLALVPNVTTLYPWESDLIRVTKSRFVHEFEIKTTVSDFKKDLTKRRHQWMSIEVNDLEDGKRGVYGAARFYYVAPAEVLEKVEVPEYAGIYRAHLDRMNVTGVEELRPAPLRHRKKIAPGRLEEILRLCMFKMWNTKEHLERELQREAA